MTQQHPPSEILLIEDSTFDETLLRQAFAQRQLQVNLHVEHTGEHGLKYLFDQGMFEETPRTDLILLDLQLPGMSGMEVLQELKTNPTTAEIPVIMMTTQDDRATVQQSYDLQANWFINKPSSKTDLLKIVDSLRTFWLTAL